MKIAAVLFDMDGTLVDSERLWQQAIDDLAAYIGRVPSAAAKASMVGTTTIESMAILHADLDTADRDADADAVWLESRVMALFVDGLVWRPGARELLAGVRDAGIPTALVTATARHIVEVMLTTIGRHNFDTIVTDDDVATGKPDPEPYRTAAARLGVDPRDCVAVEDSPTGVASALAAGCAVLAVPAEVELSVVAGVTVVASLAGVDVDYLGALFDGPAFSGPAREIPAGPLPPIPA
jgi:HAD superfamily hydrolase (TIGR01509 family)